jgi:hypothetical protein
MAKEEVKMSKRDQVFVFFKTDKSEDKAKSFAYGVKLGIPEGQMVRVIRRMKKGAWPPESTAGSTKKVAKKSAKKATPKKAKKKVAKKAAKKAAPKKARAAKANGSEAAAEATA